MRDLLRFLTYSLGHDSAEVRALSLKKARFLFRASHEQLQRLVVSSDVVDPVVPEIVQGGSIGDLVVPPQYGVKCRERLWDLYAHNCLRLNPFC